jgi:hypothetical protein
MEKDTCYLVFRPGTDLHQTFDDYQAAWEFAERWFNEGNGIALVEQFTQGPAK